MISKILSFVNIKGSSMLLPAHGWVGARATSLLAAHFALRNAASNSAEKKGSPSEGVAEGGGWGEEFRHARAEVKRFRRLALSQTSKQNNFQFLLRKIWRADVKKLKENCFALLAEFRRAETRSGANQSFFVQKRFALRSVIATNLNIANFAGSLLARSPRLRRGFARNFPRILGLNQTDGQNQKSQFSPAGGGSGRRSRQSKNTPLRNLLKCFCFPIFSACPDFIGTLRSQFFNPALFPPKAERPKATIINLMEQTL